MFTHSNTDRRAIFRKLANSLSENEPEPSAILLEILIPAALNCSANLKNLFASAFSAKSIKNQKPQWIPSRYRAVQT
jgi:hypothetical protein